MQKLLAMNWAELHEMWPSAEKKAEALLRIVETAADSISGEAGNISPYGKPCTKRQREWEAICESLKDTVWASQRLKDVAREVGLGWAHHLAGDKKLRELIDLDWMGVRRAVGQGRARERHFLRVLREVRRCAEREPATTDVAVGDDSIASQSENHLAVAWDKARSALLSRSCADLPLCEFAQRVGVAWDYQCGGNAVRGFLEKSWHQLDAIPGFGEEGTEALLKIVCVAAEAPVKLEASYLGPVLGGADNNRLIRVAMSQLGIEPSASVDLLLLSNRAKTLIQHEGVRNLGELLDFLDASHPSALRERKGIGEGTVGEFFDLLDAIRVCRADRVREYIPLRVSGCGLSFSSAAARVLSAESAENRDALFCHYGEGKTSRTAAQLSGRTTGCVNQLAFWFRKRIDGLLSHFPREKHSFWEAWERCETMEDLLEERELDSRSKRTVAGVLGRLFADSDEGKAILQYRCQLFDSWWEDLCASPEFWGQGLSVTSLLRTKGKPYLMRPFLDYLEKMPGVEVSRTTGKASAVPHHGLKQKHILRLLAAGVITTEEASQLLDEVDTRNES